MTDTFEFLPIGIVRSCFKEKFGVPKQSMMLSQALGVLKLNPDPSFRTALNHLEDFSHVWVLFVFHKDIAKVWRPTIDPPRTTGPRRIGVFASRSPHRPNPIGMSALKLERIDYEAPGGIEIHLSGLDILDGTPVLDIKPYVPYADNLNGAKSAWASADIPKYPVHFTPKSLETIASQARVHHPQLKELLVQMLELDPRPKSQRLGMPIESPQSEGLEFAFRLFDFDVRWQIAARGIHVLDLLPLDA